MYTTCFQSAIYRIFFLALLLVVYCVPALGQNSIVQFQTNAGDFNVTVNPTGNPDLQPYVESFLAYVLSGRYNNTVINRAEDLRTDPPSGDFVIQWGSFVADVTSTTDLGIGGFSEIERFDPAIVDSDGDGEVDFDTTGLSNTPGTVSFAFFGLHPNSNYSSIFVNLSDNSFLDSEGFVPFAVIEDLTTITSIANLPTVNLASQIGVSSNDLAYSSVPILGQNELIIVLQAFVIPEPAAIGSLSSGLLALATLRFRRTQQDFSF